MVGKVVRVVKVAASGGGGEDGRSVGSLFFLVG